MSDQMFDDENVEDVVDAALFKEDPVDDDMHGNYEVLTVYQVQKLMEAEISKVQSIVELPKHKLRLLLADNKWDVDSFLEKFYDGKIPTETQVKVNEVIQNQPRPNLKAGQSRKRKLTKFKEAPPTKVARNESLAVKNHQCEVCLESELSAENVYEFQCQHIICRACFKAYLTSTINDDALIDFIECPGFNCKNPVPDEIVFEQLEPDLKLKFRKLTTNAFVLHNRLIKWCIAPSCSRAIKVSVENQPPVQCKCGTRLCFKCSEAAHDLIPCNLIKSYKAVKTANLETAEWIAANSKQCPQCKVDIEKNSGCNHMVCIKCRYQFCWICLVDWNNHRLCKPLVPEIFKTSDMRWLSVCNSKYQTMVQSIKLDQKMYKAKLRKQKLSPEEEWLKIGFVQDAVEVLLRSRQILADSFIFAYFYENNEKLTSYALFKMNQNSLQQSTETLSRILEVAFVTIFDSYNDLKPRVNYAAKFCKDLSKVVVDNVKDGLDLGDWKLLI